MLCMEVLRGFMLSFVTSKTLKYYSEFPLESSVVTKQIFIKNAPLIMNIFQCFIFPIVQLIGLVAWYLR